MKIYTKSILILSHYRTIYFFIFIVRAKVLEQLGLVYGGISLQNYLDISLKFLFIYKSFSGMFLLIIRLLSVLLL